MIADSGTFWAATAAIGLGTFALRYSFILIMDLARLPDGAIKLLRFIPAAALMALITPAVFLHRTAPGGEADWRRMVAAVLAALVAWRVRNMLAAIAAGMAALWGLGLF